MWNLKEDINEPIYDTDTDIGNRLVVAKGKGVAKVLLHSTENCIQIGRASCRERVLVTV